MTRHQPIRPPWVRITTCTCRLETVNSASIDPPEPILNWDCPGHGEDPDDARDRRIDDALTREPG